MEIIVKVYMTHKESGDIYAVNTVKFSSAELERRALIETIGESTMKDDYDYSAQVDVIKIE